MFVYSGQIQQEVIASMNDFNATANTDITQAWNSVQSVVSSDPCFYTLFPSHTNIIGKHCII